MENENKLEVLVERTKEFIQQRMRETGEMMPFAAVGIDRGEIMEIGLVPPPPNFNEEGRQRWFDLIRLCVANLIEKDNIGADKITVLIVVEAWFATVNPSDPDALDMRVSQMESRREAVCFSVEAKNRRQMQLAEIKRYDDGVVLDTLRVVYDSDKDAGDMMGRGTGFFP